MTEPNPLVAYRVGGLKAPVYDEFRIVASRRLPPEMIDEAQLAGLKAAHLRRERIRRDQGFQYYFEVHDFLQKQAQKQADADNDAREWPVVDAQEWTVHADQTLTGDAVAEMLGLDGTLPPGMRIVAE